MLLLEFKTINYIGGLYNMFSVLFFLFHYVNGFINGKNKEKEIQTKRTRVK